MQSHFPLLVDWIPPWHKAHYSRRVEESMPVYSSSGSGRTCSNADDVSSFLKFV
jgi:hypothetical protein